MPFLRAVAGAGAALALAVMGAAAARAQAPVIGTDAAGQTIDLAPQVSDTAPDGPAIQSPVLTIKQQDLFERSAFGRASLARIAAGMTALQAENRTIEGRLETEERDLTDRRAAMPAADFHALAEAFDKKVEGIRAAQDAKSRAMSQEREADQKQFFDLAFPILADLMRSMGAVALIDQSTVVLSLDRIDVTDVAIARLDAALKDAQPGEAADGAPRRPAPAAGTPSGAGAGPASP